MPANKLDKRTYAQVVRGASAAETQMTSAGEGYKTPGKSALLKEGISSAKPGHIRKPSSMLSLQSGVYHRSPHSVDPFTSEERLSHYIRDGDDSSDEEVESDIRRSWLKIEKYKDLDRTDLIVKKDLTEDEKNTFSDELLEKFPKLFNEKNELNIRSSFIESIKDVSKDGDDKSILMKAFCKLYLNHINSSAKPKKILKTEFMNKLFTEMKNIDIDLTYSLLLQDAGIKLLYSEKISKKHHILKSKKFGKFKKLPTDDDIINFVEQSLIILVDSPDFTTEDITINLEEIKKSPEYENLEKYFLSHKKDIFRSHIAGHYPQQELIALFNKILKDNKTESAVLSAALSRRVINNIDKLVVKYPELLTPKNKVSFKSGLQDKIIVGLDQLAHVSKEVKDAVLEAYKSKEGRKNLDSWKNEAIRILQDDGEIKDDTLLRLSSQFMEELYDISENFVNSADTKLSRPTLGNYISSDSLLDSGSAIPVAGAAASSTDSITKGVENLGLELANPAQDMFTFIRLIHRSLIRVSKNFSGEGSFEGAQIMLGWSFNLGDSALTGRALTIFEEVQINQNKLFISLVKYPYNSNYTALQKKIENYKASYSLTDKNIAEYIVSLLKGMIAVDNPVNSYEDLKEFIQFFTYHIFCCEVHRHPAAAIHHAIALDLIINEQSNWEILLDLPMSIDGAVNVARTLQHTFLKHQQISYLYDTNKRGKLALDSAEVKVFIEKEQDLFKKWLDYNDISHDSHLEIINAMLELSKKYYGDLGFDVISATERQLFVSGEEYAGAADEPMPNLADYDERDVSIIGAGAAAADAPAGY